MIGTLLALTAGFVESFIDVFSKKLKSVDKLLLFGTGAAIPLIIAWVVVAFQGIPTVPYLFWVYVIILVPLELLGAYLYLKAVQTEDLSLIAPLINITPAIILFASWLLAIEPMRVRGAAGILLIVCGTILLTTTAPRGTIHTLTTAGGAWTLIAATIWAATSMLGKQAVLLGGVFFFLACCFLIMMAVLGCIVATGFRARIKTMRGKTSATIVRGLVNAVAVVVQNTAYLFAPVGVVIALKRTSTLWRLLWGRIVFKEQFGARRTVAAIVTFAGVLCILLP